MPILSTKNQIFNCSGNIPELVRLASREVLLGNEVKNRLTNMKVLVISNYQKDIIEKVLVGDNKLKVIDNLSDHIYNNLKDYFIIANIQELNNLKNIKFPLAWRNATTLDIPKIGSVINKTSFQTEYISSLMNNANKEEMLDFMKKLENPTFELVLQEPYCLEGTEGSSIYSKLESLLFYWSIIHNTSYQNILNIKSKTDYTDDIPLTKFGLISNNLNTFKSITIAISTKREMLNAIKHLISYYEDDSTQMAKFTFLVNCSGITQGDNEQELDESIKNLSAQYKFQIVIDNVDDIAE